MSLEEQVELLNNSCLNTGRKKDNGKGKKMRSFSGGYLILFYYSYYVFTGTHQNKCSGL